MANNETAEIVQYLMFFSLFSLFFQPWNAPLEGTAGAATPSGSTAPAISTPPGSSSDSREDIVSFLIYFPLMDFLFPAG